MSYAARHESNPLIDSTLSRIPAGPSDAYLWTLVPRIYCRRGEGPDSGRPFLFPFSQPQDAALTGMLTDGSRISFRWMAYLISAERSCRSSFRIRLVLCASIVLTLSTSCAAISFNTKPSASRSEERRVGKEGRSRW